MVKRVPVLAVVATALFLPLRNNASPQDTPSPLTPAQWVQDLDTLAADIPLYHGNAFHAASEKEFDLAVSRLRSQIGTLDEDQVLTGFARLVGMIQDGHNFMDISRGTGRFKCFPLRLGWFPEGIFVEKAAPEAAGLAGGKLISFDGVPVDSVLRQILPLLPHDPDNLANGITRIDQYLLNANILHGLGVISTPLQAKIGVEKDGKRVELALRPEVFSRRSFFFPAPGDWVDARPAGLKPPLWRLHPDSTFWLTYLANVRTLYVQLNGVADGPEETLANFSRRMAEAARSYGAEKLVLDLRWNGGGNNYLLKPLIVALIQMPEINRRGHLIVLTGPRTFSAAQNLVNRLENFTEAVFIGEPTGENVNFYGDTKFVDLPNSKCRVFLANLWWQDKDPRDRRRATYPEIAAEESWADYLQGRDPAMEYVLTHSTIPTAEEAVLDGLKTGGFNGALKGFKEFRSDPVRRYLDDSILEGKINNLGYALIAGKRLDDAIAVLKVNTEEFPASFNTWDSLGEAYADAGRKEDAIAAYRKSLELNPASRTGIEALARLLK